MQLLRIIFLKIRRIFAEILVFTKAAPICKEAAFINLFIGCRSQ